MKRTFTLAAGAIAATLMALPALAAGQHGSSAQMQGHQGGMMQGAPGGMMGDHAGMMQMMMKMHGQMMGGMHGKGMMGGNWLAVMDMDEDGRPSESEIAEGLKARMQAHDVNGDGNLSIDEFEALHSGMIRETMVDRFQHLDANGDGAVTTGEIEKGAKTMSPKHGMKSSKPVTKASETNN
ncbi:calcium-binding protein [Ruegeria sp. THAF33]|uniref:calcium-binding protein n=1 Tax=Ruegeria sp. THAF33 TaxID=2587853 RepID=UPI0012AA5918|nr:calcium-binding protein [Ruegeria sp. THAF33]QFT75681.1 hypothetical protein FIU92_21735 [Ruegeria sp. THAF33]